MKVPFVFVFLFGSAKIGHPAILVVSCAEKDIVVPIGALVTSTSSGVQVTTGAHYCKHLVRHHPKDTNRVLLGHARHTRQTPGHGIRLAHRQKEE